MGIIAEPDDDGATRLARSLLSEGNDISDVAAQTGMTIEDVEMLARTQARPDVPRLAKFMNDRLRELGLSQLEASKLGYVSRSTLNLLGKDDRVPNRNTLERLDELLSWELGSSVAVMNGLDPTPREGSSGGARRPVINRDAEDNYSNLARWIDTRLRELNMSKSRFAAIGGPGRTTLATLGTRGYRPTPETLDRIDTHLLWEPGSAMAALKGGVPINRGPALTPHPFLVPLSAIRDRLKVMKARAQRQRQALEQMERDIDDAMSHVDLVVDDLSDPRRRPTPHSWASGTDTADNADATDQEDCS
ncbi:helix-turn-helix transcriptional regulator [Mycobacterium sp. TY815]|uniref:helix-turn-helix domain-containing protein n=1 Tax=Mycobacterium sp. TY815 TaxID=3050581 RepID=UPI0027412E58|nr:helix-turn-helix transcriptional regulator [Mycobacterium sp. TY815]MDP7707408.1 helix-turn-helix transcriptional regulator [Mycobacterium sp. TY815]